ncbi:ATP-binding cassette domain-containing protein [Streptococcus didelphis]|uniref:ATP-binding cassette domain-containing protein n=1 Tax=Streptococcus didelphis TaxID=102886 RepID=A0ABY9LHJ2_9STRE|nr:ATP-binding cassette domain-containing protein [Streptococcus didelphis]WMB28270.1 ATP-binding cassette domain-containing protein [Streptococcus didelphis]WMB28944.1 ATP-binding cassette domain-containing protein [Streptococcus didelphis]
MIELKELKKSYQSNCVIDNLSTTIAKGKLTAIIGPNGSGKSTLLSLLSGLMSPDSGEVCLEEQSLLDYPKESLAKKLAFLKQSNQLSLKMTVKELVSFGRFPYSRGRLDKTDKYVIEQSLADMELLSLSDRYIDQLSGGQLQRAFIAMILAQDTDYILLDEPLNNLDLKHSVQLMILLRRLVKERQKTIIFVIHDINFASHYSDQILAMKAGKLIAHGNTENLLTERLLKELFDFPIAIETVNQRKFCVYYDLD